MRLTSTFMPEGDATGLASVSSWERLGSSHTTFLTNRSPDCAEVRLMLAERRGEKLLDRKLPKPPIQMSKLKKPGQRNLLLEK